MNRLRVLLGDEQRLFLAGLRRLVEEIDGLVVIGDTSGGHEIVAMALARKPDLVILDIEMKEMSGIDAASRIRTALPSCRVLVLSSQTADGLVRAAFKAGVSGYLLKDATLEELRIAIEATLRDEVYVSPRVSRALVHAHSREVTIDCLTPRQRQILQLVAEGMSTREISAALALSTKTVETHRAALMERLGINNIAGLVMYAVRERLVAVKRGGHESYRTQ